MSKQTENSLFIISSLPRLYQMLLSYAGGYGKLGSRIIAGIKAAHAFRDVETVRELSKILINLPSKEHQLIAEYHLIWCQHRESSKYNTEGLERIIEQSRTFKTKALFTRGAVEWYRGNSEAALAFYTEVLKTSPSITQYIDLSRTIAVLKATEGFHQSALKDLENLLPIIRFAEPVAYYDFLNSYAVELGEAGRKEEARNISDVVLASPFAFAYPEWHETARDLRPPSRSFTVVDAAPAPTGNLLQMPVIERSSPASPAWAGKSAPVVRLREWKRKMGKGKKNTQGDETTPTNLTEKEMMVKILWRLTSGDLTYDQFRRIYETVLKVASEQESSKQEDKEK